MGALTVTIWGARGSVPMPGPTHCAYGGHTPCLSVRAGDQLFILDAGTGLIPLGLALAAEGVKTIHLFLSHLHHDHTGGLPFFKPMFNPSIDMTIHCGILGGDSPQKALDTVFAPPFFPLVFSRMVPHVKYQGFNSGETLTFGDVKILTQPLNHPGSCTGFRIEHDGRSFVYATDIEHLVSAPDPDMVAFVRRADLMFYDTMMTDAEMNTCRGWGHSTWRAGARLAKAGKVKQFGAFHHNPFYDDAKIAELEAAMKADLPASFFCREQMTITL